MNIEEYREYCLSKPGTTEGFPFDENTLVFKVMDKLFALTNINQFEKINLKCDPSKAIELRETHEDIIPGFHMNKKHWNTVNTIGTLSDSLIEELIDHSYDLVVAGLPNKMKDELKN